MNIVYSALFPNRPGNHIDIARIEAAPNLLPEWLPMLVESMPNAVRPILRLVSGDALESSGLWLVANCPEQSVFVSKRE